MKRNLMSVMICGCAIVSLLLCSMSYAGNTSRGPSKNDRYEKSSNDSDQSMTDEMKAKVASILAGYNAASLTSADAKAINNAFREAGVRRGPGQKEAIEAAGFDPKKISSLDPPPDEKSQSGSKAKSK